MSRSNEVGGAADDSTVHCANVLEPSSTFNVVNRIEAVVWAVVVGSEALDAICDAVTTVA